MADIVDSSVAKGDFCIQEVQGPTEHHKGSVATSRLSVCFDLATVPGAGKLERCSRWGFKAESMRDFQAGEVPEEVSHVPKLVGRESSGL